MGLGTLPFPDDRERPCGAGPLAVPFAYEMPRCLAALKQSRKVVPRIPRGARKDSAKCLSDLINGALDDMSARAWAKLLGFAYGGLSVARQEEGGPSLTAKIRASVTSYLKCTDLTSLLEPSIGPPAWQTGVANSRRAPEARADGKWDALKKLVDLSHRIDLFL